MILNEPLCDWITLTTYEHDIAKGWMTLVAAQSEDSKATKRLQYSGRAAGGVFVGTATQRGREHFMMQVSGEVSNTVIERLAMAGGLLPIVNCTRIDLQVTIATPPDYDSRATYDLLTEWDAVGRKRQVSIVQSGDGLDTLYIGNRSSDRFTRLYVKPLTEGTALRFEVEFKGDHADHVIGRLLERGGDPGPLLTGELRAMPELPNGLLDAFLKCTGGYGTRSKPKRVYGQTSGLSWLQRQVSPAIFRLMNDHEVGPVVRELVRRWAAEANEIDN